MAATSTRYTIIIIRRYLCGFHFSVNAYSNIRGSTVIIRVCMYIHLTVVAVYSNIYGLPDPICTHVYTYLWSPVSYDREFY